MALFDKIPENPTETVKERLEEFEQATTQHAHRYLVRRWGNFKEVGHKALLWLIVVLVLAIGVIQQTKALDSYYKVDIPASGGTYSEGVVGRIENLNPLFASSAAETSVAHLLFGGLLKYSASNGLVGDLASSWQVDESGKVYTVTLRQDARWHDGHPIRSDDVLYTIKTIQNSATRSPLASSWKGVKVEALNQQTVQFTLPSAFPPFPFSLTLGIIPKHVLASTPSHQLRTAAFNSHPTVGSGPFKFREVRNFQDYQEARLVKNNDYYDGNVQLDRFTLQAYEEYQDAVSAFRNHEFSAIGGLQPQELSILKDEQDAGLKYLNAPLMHETLAFFKTTQPLLNTSATRQALSMAIDKKAIATELGDWVKPVNLPLLKGQLGYKGELDTSHYNRAKAGKMLDEAGWKRAKNGMRKKDGKPFTLNLVASSSGEYPKVAAELQRQWQQLGIKIQTTLVKPSELQQNVIIPHNYDILLYELSLGQDPDVFAYWHSSQAAEKGLNLSEYNSQIADEALEGGRTSIGSALREAKYEAFLKEWQSEAPAVALYQPGYGYAHRTSVTGFKERTLVSPVDRYYNVADWTAEKREAVETH